jgi:cell division protein FtsQ
MAGMVSVSRTDLRDRRQKLRRQRQMKIIQAIWRTFAVSGLLGGLLWVASQPMWVLETPKQIEIKSGDRSLSHEAIKSVLVLSYPQSLWRIEPSAIANSLTKQPTIEKANVNRRLFPPGLIIDIQERVPVAIAQTHQQPTKQRDTNNEKATGLLDVNGIWIPLEKYISLNPTVKLPSLIVIGSFEQYRPYWNQLYQSVSQSSVKIMEIDCQDSTNVILKTELGYVHLGAVSPQISEQMKVLAQMSHLPTQLNPNRIEYIDLKNPESPLVQMNQKPVKSNSQTR